MTIGLLGKKIGMTHIFNSKGNRIPVTVISSGPCYITQIKSHEKCGYNAIQLGYSEIGSTISKKKKIKKPLLGHFDKAKVGIFKYLKEYKVNQISKFNIGDQINLNLFTIGEKISVTGMTIGKGTTGNIKLHNFNRGAMTHGSKHHRLQGSMGSGTTPGRVFPGKRMPRRSGMKKQTIHGLEIVELHLNENILVLKGSIPGKNGNLIYLKKEEN